MALQCVVVALALTLLGSSPRECAPQQGPGTDEDGFDLENYDLTGETDWENMDLNSYGDSFDYNDVNQEVMRTNAHIRGVFQVEGLVKTLNLHLEYPPGFPAQFPSVRPLCGPSCDANSSLIDSLWEFRKPPWRASMFHPLSTVSVQNAMAKAATLWEPWQRDRSR